MPVAALNLFNKIYLNFKKENVEAFKQKFTDTSMILRRFLLFGVLLNVSDSPARIVGKT
jgi:hypothetical protein